MLMLFTIPLAAGLNNNIAEEISSKSVNGESPNPDIVGRVWPRGWLFRRIKSGHLSNVITIRLNFIEFTPTESGWGVVIFQRVPFRDFL